METRRRHQGQGLSRQYHPPLPSGSWTPDFLGGTLFARALEVPDNGQGEAVATLVHDAPPARPEGEFAVLYVHGWSDYFFNREMAEFFTSQGGEFYAVDMHACGRSLRPHQHPGYVSDLGEHFPDLDAAVAFIRRAHPVLPLIVLAHSQGGLTAALWAKHRQHRPLSHGRTALVDGLILNAPWLDQPHTPLVRKVLTPWTELLGRVLPRTPVPIPSPRLYEQVISAKFGGEWPVNEDWRPDPHSPSRPGWARAILRAQNEFSRGIGLSIPTLTITSHRSLISPVWREEMRHLDMVTDVRQTWRRVPLLGRNFEIIKVRGAIHDVFLSAPRVRAKALEEVALWLNRKQFASG